MTATKRSGVYLFFSGIRILNYNIESFNNAIQTFPESLVNGLVNQEKEIPIFSDAEAEAAF